MELSKIKEEIKELEKKLEMGIEQEEGPYPIKWQIELLKIFELQSEAALHRSEAKPGEISYRDPVTLKPHPISAKLYSEISCWEIKRWRTDTSAELNFRHKMDTSDILKSIDREGILVPLVINEDGIIISGCRRHKAALQLGLKSVPVEVRSFENEADEKRAILDYNRYREKTMSQKMREAELLKELVGQRAKRKMLAGRRDPTLIFGEGYSPKRKDRETDAIIGARFKMGKDTFRKVEQIWIKAKEGDQKATELIGALDKGAISVNAAHNALKKCVGKQGLTRWQRLGPVDPDEIWTCPQCNRRFRIIHFVHGEINKHSCTEYYGEASSQEHLFNVQPFVSVQPHSEHPQSAICPISSEEECVQNMEEATDEKNGSLGSMPKDSISGTVVPADPPGPA